jgi:hypothetical protein
MELNKAIKIALDGDAILLTGSGFSHGAKNVRMISGTNRFDEIPTGTGLTKLLLAQLKLDFNNQNLGVVSRHFIKKIGKKKLINLLTECFTVSSVANHHKELMQIDWRRIYTTNYDKVVETAATSVGKIYKTISLNDRFDESKNKICLHINGVIDELSEKTLDSRFKLTTRSYNSEPLEGNPWFDFMSRNLQNAKAIFIVGFSMAFDLDLTRVISNIAEKNTVVFVTSPAIDEIEKSGLEDYGNVYPIGVEGLSAKIKELSKTYTPKASTEYNYMSFIHYASRDVAIHDDIGLSDILDFYSQGRIRDAILAKNTLGYGKYIVFRKQIDIILNNWKNYKVFIVSSYLGNGKTVFCHELIQELRDRDIDVFHLVNDSVDISDDIEAICNFSKKCIVIIDDFYKHYTALKDFDAYDCKNITFVLTGRIIKEESNIRKVTRQLRIPISKICTVSLNRISKDECENLAISMQNGNFVPQALRGRSIDDISSYLQNECRGRIADIALYLYESGPVKKKLEELYQTAIKNHEGLKGLTISSICNTVMSLGLSKHDIGLINDIDFVVARSNAPEIFDELFESGNNISELKSSIVAREILYHIIGNHDAIHTLIRIAEYADKRSTSDTRYKEILNALVSHHNFSSRKYSFNKAYVKSFYEEIRTLSFYRKNHFFWEQFALACMDIQDFKTAHQCLSNAYEEGGKNHWFVPFQICTIEAELIITENRYKISSIMSIDSETMVEVSDSIRRAKELLLKHYDHEENNKGYVFSITSQIPPLYDLVKSYYTKREHSIYIEDVNELSKKLKVYSDSEEGKRSYNISKTQKDLEQSISEAKQFLKC